MDHHLVQMHYVIIEYEEQTLLIFTTIMFVEVFTAITVTVEDINCPGCPIG